MSPTGNQFPSEWVVIPGSLFMEPFAFHISGSPCQEAVAPVTRIISQNSYLQSNQPRDTLFQKQKMNQGKFSTQNVNFYASMINICF